MSSVGEPAEIFPLDLRAVKGYEVLRRDAFEAIGLKWPGKNIRAISGM